MKKSIAMLLVVTLLFSMTFGLAEESAVRTSKLREILTEAFSGTELMDVVDIPYGTETIDSRAFADAGTKLVYIPSTVQEIADDAFEGTNVTISSPSSSYAQSYAEENGLLWEDCGTHYKKAAFDSAMDFINNPVQEDFYMENMEFLSEEGVTDPEMLEFIRGYNEIAAEAQTLVDSYNAFIDEGKPLFEELVEAISDASVSTNENNMIFSFGEAKMIMDQSIPEDLEVISTELAEDGSTTIVETNHGNYYMWLSDGVMHFSKSPAFTEKQLVAVPKAQTNEQKAKSLLSWVEATIIGIQITYDKIEKWVKKCNSRSRRSSCKERTIAEVCRKV